MSAPPISVVVIARNEEANIVDCLRSVAWADERIVIDGQSEDRTVAEAENQGAQVLTHPWMGYGPQKNWGAEQARNDWILFLDADERVDMELARAIRDADYEDVAGFWIDRKNYFWSWWISYESPDWILRLVDRRRGSYDGKEVHEALHVEGTTKRLDGHLDHFSYTGISDYLQRLDRYTTLAAREAHGRGRKGSRWTPFLRFPFEFLKRYLLRGGIRDGWIGLLYAFLSTIYVFVKYMKLWELQTFGEGRAKR